MLVEAVGILAITAVGGPTAWLNISHAVRGGAEHPQEGFGMHRPRANFDVVGLLQDAALLYPEMRKGKNQVLKVQAFLFKFYFNFQVVSKNSLVCSRRSLWNSIHAKAASRSSATC